MPRSADKEVVLAAVSLVKITELIVAVCVARNRTAPLTEPHTEPTEAQTSLVEIAELIFAVCTRIPLLNYEVSVLSCSRSCSRSGSRSCSRSCS